MESISPQPDCPSGYSIDVLENLEDKYKCNLCDHVLKNPCQNSCGHRFCKDCLDYGINNNLKCKNCQENNYFIKNKTFLDRAFMVEMNKLSAKCINNNCTWKGAFLDYKSHCNDCNFRLKSCKFNYCKEKYMDENEHKQNNINNHIDCLYELYKEFSNKICTITAVVTVLNREISTNGIREINNSDINNIEKIKSLEYRLTIEQTRNKELELRIKSLEMTSYNGTLIWKINDFAKNQLEAKSGRTSNIYSPPFYTSKTGYKMCGRLYINGDGMGKGTHISLFFVIMRGEYDALLKWPFVQKVTFMILDQDNKNHVIDAFRPDPTSSSFKRPNIEMNIASGCPMILSLSDLNNHGYVKNNTMFIKIIVDTDDLTV